MKIVSGAKKQQTFLHENCSKNNQNHSLSKSILYPEHNGFLGGFYFCVHFLKEFHLGVLISTGFLERMGMMDSTIAIDHTL